MNNANLRPVQNSAEARERGRNGGRASVKAKRERKAFREAVISLLDEPDTCVIGGRPVTRREYIAARALRILLDETTTNTEFIRAFETVRDTIGEIPRQELHIERENANYELKELIECLRGEE